MNNFKQKLGEFINSSDLTADQKEMWRLFILKANDMETEAVFEAVNEGRDCLMLLTNNLRDKIADLIRQYQISI